MEPDNLLLQGRICPQQSDHKFFRWLLPGTWAKVRLLQLSFIRTKCKYASCPSRLVWWDEPSTEQSQMMLNKDCTCSPLQGILPKNQSQVRPPSKLHWHREPTGSKLLILVSCTLYWSFCFKPKWQQCVWKPSSCSQSPHNSAPSAGYWGGQCGAKKFSVKQMYILGFTCGLPTNTLPLSPLSLHHNPSPQRLTFWDLFGRTAWEQHSFVEGSYIRQNCSNVFNHKIVCEYEESVLDCQHHSIVH